MRIVSLTLPTSKNSHDRSAVFSTSRGLVRARRSLNLMFHDDPDDVVHLGDIVEADVVALLPDVGLTDHVLARAGIAALGRPGETPGLAVFFAVGIDEVLHQRQRL